MHIGIQVTPKNFILLTSAASRTPEILARLPYSTDDLTAASCLLTASLPPDARSVMMSLPAAWSWSARALMLSALQTAVPEAMLVPVPLLLLHALPEKKAQDIFWWEPWGNHLAFGFISRLPGWETTLEGYATGSREDCLSAAVTYGYQQQDIWHLELCLRPDAAPSAANLLPVKLETVSYAEDILRDGLTRCASTTKRYLDQLKLVGVLPFQLVPGHHPNALPIPAITTNLEYPYQELTPYADASTLAASFFDSEPVRITGPGSPTPLWSGTAAELKEASVWIHPATGHIEVIKNSAPFFSHQFELHPQSILESRLDVPMPVKSEDITASLQLMQQHLAMKPNN